VSREPWNLKCQEIGCFGLNFL